MSEQEKNYSSYAHDDLAPAKKMRIERTIYIESDRVDISTLTALPLAELIRLRQESEAAEQSIFAKLQSEAAAWEQQAGNTRFIEKAIEYVKTPEVSHTSNEWKDEQYDRHVISNRVYIMQYHIYENTRYDPVKKESICAFSCCSRLYCSMPIFCAFSKSTFCRLCVIKESYSSMCWYFSQGYWPHSKQYSIFLCSRLHFAILQD